MPYASPAQRHYFFNENSETSKTKKDLEIEARLAAIKIKIAAEEEAEGTEDPSIPPEGNPYREEVLNEQANKHNDEERTHE